MRRKLTLAEELNRMRGLIIYENGDYKNPIIKEEVDTPPVFTKKIDFAPGWYTLKGKYTSSKSGKSWSWDIPDTLKEELNNVKDYLIKNPKGYILGVKIEAGESQIPNTDNTGNRGKYPKNKVPAKWLSERREETIEKYLKEVFSEWKTEGIVGTDNIEIIKEEPVIGKTKWVGQPFCPADSPERKTNADGGVGYLCTDDFRSYKDHDSLSKQYTEEQYVKVTISVNKTKDEGTGGKGEDIVFEKDIEPIPKTPGCAAGVVIELFTNKHNCQNAEIFVYANKTLLTNTDGGYTHNGSNADGSLKINNFTISAKALNSGYGKLGTLKYGTNGNIGQTRYDKFIITPEQSREIIKQSDNGTMVIWAICTRNSCHNDMIVVTVKHPKRTENVFGPKPLSTNKGWITVLSPCGDAVLTDTSQSSVEKSEPDYASMRTKWFNDRKELTLKLNSGKQGEEKEDFKSTVLNRLTGIGDIADQMISEVMSIYKRNPDNEKSFNRNLNSYIGKKTNEIDIIKSLISSEPSLKVKKNEGGKLVFQNKWVNKDNLSQDIRNGMTKNLKVLSQIFDTNSIISGGDWAVKKDVFSLFKSGNLEFAKDTKVYDDTGKSIEI